MLLKIAFVIDSLCCKYVYCFAVLRVEVEILQP